MDAASEEPSEEEALLVEVLALVAALAVGAEARGAA